MVSQYIYRFRQINLAIFVYIGIFMDILIGADPGTDLQSEDGVGQIDTTIPVYIPF